MTINWWKKIDVVKIKLHLNENIEWHCMQFELNWIQIFWFELNWIQIFWFEFKYIEGDLNWIKIQLKRNGMQIGEETNENLFVIMVLLEQPTYFKT